MKEATVTVKLKTIQVRKMPDVTGFLKAMRGLGASVTIEGNKIIVDVRGQHKESK